MWRWKDDLRDDERSTSSWMDERASEHFNGHGRVTDVTLGFASASAER
jgi:hypothetical protein